MAGQQQEEIETIRSRTIEVKLSDADVKRISEKAAAHGLTVGELIENFIGDLVCGTYSNHSFYLLGSYFRTFGIIGNNGSCRKTDRSVSTTYSNRKVNTCNEL